MREFYEQLLCDVEFLVREKKYQLSKAKSFKDDAVDKSYFKGAADGIAIAIM